MDFMEATDANPAVERAIVILKYGTGAIVLLNALLLLAFYLLRH